MKKLSFTLALVVIFAAGLAAQGDVPETPKIPEHVDPQTTASGLIWSELKAGENEDKPRMFDQVEVHYRGWQRDGRMFDSSYERGRPAKFRLGSVIEGWNEGLQLMNVGDVFKLEIPWSLAYGAQGHPGAGIGPKQDLIFQVELLGLVRAPRVPEFPKLDPAEMTEVGDGLKCKVLSEPEGAPAVGPKDLVLMRYTVWNRDGRAMRSSLIDGRPVTVNGVTFGADFLKKATKVAHAGGEYVFQVPGDLGFQGRNAFGLPADIDTVWQIAFERVIPFSVPGEPRVTESGLEYHVLEPGEAGGKKPTARSQVRVNYVGWLTDGTIFDTSFKRGEPLEIGLGSVIPGWTEGLQLMPEGSTYLFTIPWRLAYGAEGRSIIPPKADLVFWIELIEVK